MKTLICMGDSLTEGADIPVGHTWPVLVGNALNIEVINCGIGGDTTAGMLARLHPEVIAKGPAMALIMGGTNDLWWGLPINAVLANLFSMVFQCRHYDITPAIGLPPPVHTALADQNAFSPPWDGYDRFGRQMDRLVETLTLQATESEVVLINLYRPFVSPTGMVKENLYLPDGLHPNRSGHQTMAAVMIEALRQP